MRTIEFCKAAVTKWSVSDSQIVKENISGILQQRIELDKECMFQYTQLRKEVRLMDGQTSVAPVLMRFQRGCQQVRLDCG